MELINKKTLEKLIDKNKPVVVCVSTGIDSMSLFHYLVSLNYTVVIAHVNHKKRAESDIEYSYLENLAKEKNIPFIGYVLNKIEKGNFQEEARKLRYEFFLKVARDYKTDQIVVAHQEDDKVETIIMRLIRGTSIRGYSGIKEISYIEDVKIIRPMLNVTREKIEAYQKENNLKYFEDSSNKEDHYTRNIIRHKITPVMKEINSDFYSAIDNYSEDLNDMYELVDSLALDFIKNKAIVTDNEISYKKSDFDLLKRIVKKQVVLRAINILSNNTLELAHKKASEIIDFNAINSESKTIEIGSNIKASIEYDNYVFFKDEEIEKINVLLDSEREYSVEGYGKIILSNNYHLLPNKNSYLLCYNNLDKIYPIFVRNVMFGDKITVNGITKKVYDLLKEHKVPKRLREKTLVFIRNEEIFFIPGIIRKETDKTKENKLYITYLGETYGN